jgi:hypothetical protein
MRTMPAHEYNGYTIVINPAGTPGGRFTNAFSVHKGFNRSHPLAVSVVHQNSISTANTFATEEEASASAMELARAWVNAQAR